MRAVRGVLSRVHWCGVVVVVRVVLTPFSSVVKVRTVVLRPFTLEYLELELEPLVKAPPSSIEPKGAPKGAPPKAPDMLSGQSRRAA